MENYQFNQITKLLDRMAHALETIASEMCARAALPSLEHASEEPTDEDIAAARDEILSAYNAGKIVQYNPIADPLAGWIDCHRWASPHIFEWDDNYYRLPSRK